VKRPVCPICLNKVKDNLYRWDFEKQVLVHESCRKLSKEVQDALVTVEPLSLNTRARR
jgi:hypothetical protein